MLRSYVHVCVVILTRTRGSFTLLAYFISRGVYNPLPAHYLCTYTCYKGSRTVDNCARCVHKRHKAHVYWYCLLTDNRSTLSFSRAHQDKHIQNHVGLHVRNASIVWWWGKVGAQRLNWGSIVALTCVYVYHTTMEVHPCCYRLSDCTCSSRKTRIQYSPC